MIANKFPLLPLALFLTGTLVQADEIKFQRIRTFDPVRGLVPGNITNSLMAPKLPAAATAPGTNVVAPVAPGIGGVAPQASLSTPGTTTPPGTTVIPRRTTVSAPEATESETTMSAPGGKPYRSSMIKTEPLDSNDSSTQPTDQQDLNSTPANRPYRSGMLAPEKPDPTPTSILAPPDAPRRPPQPPVDNNALLPQVETINIKPALSWRAKAFKLAALPDNPTDSGKHPTLVMNGSIEDSLNALAQACKAKGVQLLGKSIPAGQLGARTGDATSGRYLLLFVAKKISNDRTLVKTAIDPDSRPQKAAILQDLLLQAASIVDGKGLL
jgi:hypothetical protein